MKKPKTTAPKKKPTKQSIWSVYGLKRPAKPRYVGLPGVLWFVMSRYVRKSEFQQYDGMCVDGCGRRVDSWEDADCGHFMAASRGLATRFLRENLGLQTKHCNNPTWSPDSAYGFGITIDERYGKGTAAKIERLSKTVCKSYDYDGEIIKYIALWEALPE